MDGNVHLLFVANNVEGGDKEQGRSYHLNEAHDKQRILEGGELVLELLQDEIGVLINIPLTAYNISFLPSPISSKRPLLCLSWPSWSSSSSLSWLCLSSTPRCWSHSQPVESRPWILVQLLAADWLVLGPPSSGYGPGTIERAIRERCD